MGLWLIAAVLLADPQIELPKGRLVVIGGGDRSAGSVRMLWMRAIDQFRVLLERGGVAEPPSKTSHCLPVGDDGS